MTFGGSFVKEIVIIDALRTPVGKYDGKCLIRNLKVGCLYSTTNQ